VKQSCRPLWDEHYLINSPLESFDTPEKTGIYNQANPHLRPTGVHSQGKE